MVLGRLAALLEGRRKPRAETAPAPSAPAPRAPEPDVVAPARDERAPSARQREGADDRPREWNLWELERLAREHVAEDVARNEERAYLLLHLREFAGPDGRLPGDFDALVREAFGDLLGAVAT